MRLILNLNRLNLGCSTAPEVQTSCGTNCSQHLKSRVLLGSGFFFKDTALVLFLAKDVQRS